MATQEKIQKYYDMLTRLQHPAFRKVNGDVLNFDKDTPFHAVFNYMVAKEMCRFRDDMELVRANKLPHTVTEEGIDQWEETLFGFTKLQLPFADRKAQLIARYRQRVTMGVPDAIALAEAITGLTPAVVRNLFFDGWILDDPDKSVLDISTILSATSQASYSHIYVLIFGEVVDSDLLARLDEELTKIEKGGSTHILISPDPVWELDVSVLGTDTILG